MSNDFRVILRPLDSLGIEIKRKESVSFARTVEIKAHASNFDDSFNENDVKIVNETRTIPEYDICTKLKRKRKGGTI